MMNDINNIENRLSLFKESIAIEDLVDEYLCEESLDYNPNEFRASIANSIIERFTDIYNLNIISTENGNSTFVISTDQNIKAKKYLHRFLTYKNITGGEGANSDGSVALFERISANAVRYYLGANAKIILVGECGECLTEKVLREISIELNEKSGTFDDLPVRAKDDGVDFISYKPFDNRNIGSIVILGQACVGKHAIDKKPIKDRWKVDYIKYAIRPPLTLLSVVEYLDAGKLKSVHSDFNGAIVFDRGRIMRYYDSSDSTLNADIQSWVITNITEDE